MMAIAVLRFCYPSKIPTSKWRDAPPFRNSNNLSADVQHSSTASCAAFLHFEHRPKQSCGCCHTAGAICNATAEP